MIIWIICNYLWPEFRVVYHDSLQTRQMFVAIKSYKRRATCLSVF